MWGFPTLKCAAGDLRYAVRQVIRRPAWTLVVVSTLALGVGANTAMFTLIDSLLFRPASWNKDSQLVWISSLDPRSGRVGRISYDDYVAYRATATTLSDVLAYGGSAMSVGGSRPQRVLGGVVSGNYFDVLRIRAALGRTFAPAEDAEPGAHPVVVLSDALWKEHFGADPRVVNSSVAINGRPFTIIGIAPAGFTGAASANDPEQLWVPLAMQAVAMPTSPELLNARSARWLRAAGRLRDGATAAEADAEIRVMARQLNPAGTPPDREMSGVVTSMRGGLNPWEQRDLTPVFGLLAIVPALVLLVACTNVANVLMARNLSRRKEFAIRRAIGASRGRLIRLLLTESLLLALLSALAGFAISFGLIALITHYGGVPADPSGPLTPDVRALLATTALAIMTTVIFGLAPALTSTRFEVLPALNDEGPASTLASGGSRLRRVFVVTQLSVSLALLIAAGLFLQSLSKALQVDAGFEPRGAVAVSFDPDLQGYTAARRDAFVTQLVERTSSLPGVTSVAVTGSLPLGGRINGGEVIAEGTASVQGILATVSSRYFHTMGVPLLRGRDFSATDTDGGVLVAIVDETLARRLWPGADPIGARVRMAGGKAAWHEVVGVVRDTRFASLTEPPRGTCYLALGQHAASPLSLVVRTAGDSTTVLSSIANIGQVLDRDLPLFQAQRLEDSVRHAVTLQRGAASLFAVFGGLALLLAAIGVHGVVAQSVSLRMREVGIRMSLGARAGDVFRMFLRESLSLALIGVAVGLTISAAISKLLTAFLFGLAPTDMLTFAGGATILCLVAIAASYFPARRAAQSDPTVALRHQ